jgi:hypothetical protein
MLDRHQRLMAFVAAVLCAPTALQAQGDEPIDRTPVDCITVSRIDTTDVIDDQTVIFFMRGKGIYRNYLPQKCPRLEAEDRFGYQTRSSRLCSVDLVTVLPRLGIPISCRLGDFHPITSEEVEELRAIRDEARAGDGVEARPAEPPPEPATRDAAEPESAPPRE